MKESRSLANAKSNGGFCWLGNNLVDNYLHLLSGLGLKVYVYLVRHTFQTNSSQITKPLSASEIANALNRTSRSISKALKEIVYLGIIEIIKSPGKASRYRLLETYEENFPGGRKKTSQGTEEDFTPPMKKASHVDDAKPYRPGAGGSPKSTKSILRAFKKGKGLKPVQQPSGCGPRKV